MLSQMKIRLFPPSVVLQHLVKRTSLSTTSVHLSSKKKKDESNEPVLDAGISKPVTRLSRRTNTNDNQLFDDAFKALEPKVKFQNKRRTKVTAESASKMKPGQLNLKMNEAAKNVAKKAGSNEAQVLDDILGKLDEVFVGMDKHVKKSARKNASNKNNLGKYPNIQPPTESGKEIDLDSLMLEANDFSHPIKSYTPESRQTSRPFANVEELLQSEKPLEIFSLGMKTESGSSLKLWEKFTQAELQRSTRFEPLNWFDQCIVWTEEGKLWKFPIDNEQGMDDEAKVDFTEHIFLDHHIEHWCPTEGPIRHFMELVLVGLSKNPYISVSEKIETLKWYEQYFMKHEVLLKEINAFGSVANPIPVEGKVTEV